MQLIKRKLACNKSILAVLCILILLFGAVALLWSGRSRSNQAMSAMIAQIYFDGEYRIADGPWQKIVNGQHIPSTKGDVTLRGNFHMLTPDGEYVGLYGRDLPVAFYTNHINLTLYEGKNEPVVIDMENPLFGDSACGINWTAHFFTAGCEDPIEILIHNPHSFGNEQAIDELLSHMSIWSGIDFEKRELESGAFQRNTGLFFLIVSFVLLGTALFSTLIHIKNNGILWIFGLMILSAGTYFTFTADGVSFWQEYIITNTTVLGCSMMFYMLFLSMVATHFLKTCKKLCIATIAAIGAFDLFFFVLPIVTDVYFYDTWRYWAVLQAIANLILLGCLVKETICPDTEDKWVYIGMMLPLITFGLDAIMTALGYWQGGVASKYVFCGLFIVTMVLVLRIIPGNINAAAKAKELETERNALNAQLAQSRISTMMSQIRPHFIYNTLGSIEQLCYIEPPKAGKLVHDFAMYLRGNFGELDNPRPIRMSQEMEHVRYYISIESVRFPDMTFTFDMKSNDFMLPALSIQPIVENAIKHGLMPLDRGGSVHVTSWETPSSYCVCVEDNGVGFDTNILLDERKHIGLRNIRERMESTVNGSMTIESTPGKGTKVQLTIPKEKT
jgi:hypothetical protein